MYSFANKPTARRIPVRVVNKAQLPDPTYIEPDIQPEAAPSVKKDSVEAEQGQPETKSNGQEQVSAEETIKWETLAKRQQADMENFRKRQARRAEEAIAAEKERLLRLILPIGDNLARALSQQLQDTEPLRQGIELTQREFNRILSAEGVTQIDAVGQPFDPNWHEALAVLPSQAEPNTVIEEIEAGYKLGDRLLRPAKVIVAA